VVIKQQGRERYCEAKLAKLNEVSNWVEQYRQVWEARLDQLEEYLAELQGKTETQPAPQSAKTKRAKRNK
jgi:hypothetical protein